MIIAGAVLTGLGAPRLIGALGGLPGDAIWQALERGDRAAVSTRDLETLRDARIMAVTWTADEAARFQLGVALAELARVEGIAEDTRRQHLSFAADQLRRSLVSAPADPLAWLQLAYVDLLANGPSAGAAAAITRSMETGRFQPHIMISRLQIGLVTWPVMTPAQRRVVADQVALIWRYKPPEIARLGLEPRFSPVLDELMAADFDQYKLRQKWVLWARRKASSPSEP